MPSFPSIYFALNKFFLDNNIIVITNNCSVKKILVDLNIEVIFLDFTITPNNVFKAKKKLDDFLKKKIDSKDLYLLDNIHCLEGFYISAHWPNGTVYYSNLSSEFPLYSRKLKYKYKFIQFFYNIVLKIDLIFREQNAKPFLGIDNNFIAKNNIKKIKYFDDTQIKLNILDKITLKIPNFDNILVLQGNLDGVITKESIDVVFSEIKKISSLGIKQHPKHYFNRKMGYEIPSHYPVELCYSNINNNIISIFSLSLIIASKLKNKKAISLLELVDWFDADYKKQMKTILLSETDNILFPKTLIELNKELNCEGTF